MRAKDIALDLLVFLEICLYWPFAVLVMRPALWLDRRLGTALFARMDRLMRRIAGVP